MATHHDQHVPYFWAKLALFTLAGMAVTTVGMEPTFEKFTKDGRLEWWEAMIIVGTILAAGCNAALAYLMNPREAKATGAKDGDI